jgi:exopolyphosphatase / guanosine-5'-triphosphate,3'-diphosphate pyrophosphatase
MRVAAIDVGSNTVRLLVATLEDGSVEPVREERTAVGLAREIERTGRIPDKKIARAADVARRYARDAAKLGAARIEVLVTAPARQGRNGSELVEAISAATRLPVRPLSAEEEGRLAFAGVVSTFPTPPASIAVVDVGGGSTQLVFGTVAEPVWFRTLDIGSLRLAQRHFVHDPPRSDELDALRASIERAFEGHASPLPRCAVATGGTARSLRRVVGRTLGRKELAEAESVLSSAPAVDLAEKFGFPIWRGQTLLAGAFVLAEAQRRLGVPLVVARAGLREGAVLESLLEEQAA